MLGSPIWTEALCLGWGPLVWTRGGGDSRLDWRPSGLRTSRLEGASHLGWRLTVWAEDTPF